MKLRDISALALILALAGCATPYQEMGFLGGVEANRISEDTIQVIARGNGYTDSATIQRYALRKAAEATVSAGYDLFVIASVQDSTTTGHQSFGTIQRANSGFFSNSTSWDILKPGQTVLVRMLKGPRPADASPYLYDAHDILKFAATGSYMPPGPTK